MKGFARGLNGFANGLNVAFGIEETELEPPALIPESMICAKPVGGRNDSTRFDDSMVSVCLGFDAGIFVNDRSTSEL